MVQSVFTVLFEDPFWVGYLERTENGTILYGRIVFGKEPTNAELIEFMLYRFHEVSVYPSHDRSAIKTCAHLNFKRSLRQAKRTMKGFPKASKARDAVKRGYEAQKRNRIKNSG